jgi:hypothetical protein
MVFFNPEEKYDEWSIFGIYVCMHRFGCPFAGFDVDVMWWAASGCLTDRLTDQREYMKGC